MNVEELLDELRSNILRDSSGLIIGPSDSMWTDATFIRYLNDAQRRFARRTLCLRDGHTPACCEVVLAEGVIDYTLHTSVLAVLSARNESEEGDIPRASHFAFTGSMQPDTEPYGTYPVSTGGPAPGLPRAWDTDERLDSDGNDHTQVVHLRVWPKPSAAETGKRVYLRVIRLPLVALDENNLMATPEIPEDYHLDLLEWVAYRALRNWDVDGEDRQKAESHKTRFAECVEEAKQETKRKLFAPMQWQFGMNGFSYIK
jgi:hypothetical protein